MEDYKLLNYLCRTSKKNYPIYCVKFCPYSDEYIFATAILNKVEIHKVDDEEGKIKLLKTFESERKDEYFYSLDWTFDKKTDDIILVGGGAKGEIYNFLTSSVFGIHKENNAINELKFSPKDEYLFAAAYEDGIVCLYNLQTETCIAMFENHSVDHVREAICVCFDPLGNYLAFGGMTKELFIINLKDNQAFQDNLKKSLDADEEIIPLNLNLIHNACVLSNLHVNYIDTINWYDEDSFMTKSANGDIIFWYIKGLNDQPVPFASSNDLKVVKQHTINIENCNLWFVRFSIDPFLKYLSIGTCSGELCIWKLHDGSFSNWKCHIFKHKFTQATIRQCTFSHNGKFLVCCTDDGYLVAYKKSEEQLMLLEATSDDEEQKSELE